jgi:hypothetical protein
MNTKSLRAERKHAAFTVYYSKWKHIRSLPITEFSQANSKEASGYGDNTLTSCNVHTYSKDYFFIGRWVVKLVERLLTTAALWVRIQTSLSQKKKKIGDISKWVANTL